MIESFLLSPLPSSLVLKDPMTVTAQTSMHTDLPRWALSILVCTLLLTFGVAPAFAQNGGDADENREEQIEQLKASYENGMKAAKAGNHSQAYANLEEALQLAQDLDQSGAINQITGYLEKLPKNWGNEAIENEAYENALNHFERGVKYAGDDAYMYYGRGLALLNLERTEEGLESLQEAMAVGNKTGNTRVTNLAAERIRGEFLNRASEALNAQNPTTQQANTALEALDEMRDYVDPNAQSLFYRGRALFERGDLQQAIEAAQEGLRMHQGSRSDAAKFHFIIGESQLQLGNTSVACQTFEDAAFGDYQARAEHYLENDCQ